MKKNGQFYELYNYGMQSRLAEKSTIIILNRWYDEIKIYHIKSCIIRKRKVKMKERIISEGLL